MPKCELVLLLNWQYGFDKTKKLGKNHYFSQARFVLR
nr:MAG TPA: hypothetical protein [Caudoviricetes sp.]